MYEEPLSSKIEIAEKMQDLPVGEIVGSSSSSRTPYRVILNNSGQNDNIVLNVNVFVNINNNCK